MRTNRYYAARSMLYGWTVYDRETQTPAFAEGADINMDQLKAVMLAMRLSRAEARGVATDDRP